MYKIKNATSGSLSIQLEKGSIILLAGKSHDLDGVCSRYWIATSVTLQKLIKVGAIQVLEDSESHIQKDTIKNVVDPSLDVYTDTGHHKPSIKERAVAANKRHVSRSPVKNVVDSKFEVFTSKIPKTPAAEDQFRKSILQKNVARIVAEDKKIHNLPIPTTPIHSVVSPHSITPTDVRSQHISEKRGLKFVFKYDDEPIIIDLTKLEKEKTTINQEEVVVQSIPVVIASCPVDPPEVVVSEEGTSNGSTVDAAPLAGPSVEEPVKKKRGRPKKVIVEDTKNDE